MTASRLAVAALFCVLAACSEDAPRREVVQAATTCDASVPPPTLVQALTTIDSFPTRLLVDFAAQPDAGIDRVTALATDPRTELGLQIRAIRLLPQYCPEDGCADAPAHSTLYTLVQQGVLQLSGAQPVVLAPDALLRLRAAVEALGATHSGLDSDALLFTAAPQALIHHPVRDVQVTAVRAMRELCNSGLCSKDVCTAEVNALRALKASSPGPLPQVELAIVAALQELSRCAPP